MIREEELKQTLKDKLNIMMKKIYIISIIICVEFLLFAVICNDINPAMWANEARIGYAISIVYGLFLYSVIYR